MGVGDYMILWTILIIVFTVAEAMTLGLTSIWFAVGALAALIASALGFNLFVQFLAFLLVAFVLLYYTRPLAKKIFKVGHNKTNIDALIGKKGYVVQPITPQNNGQVKLGGQIWSARSTEHETYEVGEEVQVIAIEGVKLIVARPTKE